MNPIVFISGAGSGIGAATALKFAQHNYPVILCGRRADKLEAVQRKILDSGGRAHILQLDIRDLAKVNEAIRGLPEDWREVRILINNAGLAVGLSTIDEGDPDDWDRMIDTNVKGLLYLSRALLPGMIERKQGHIVNIGSIAGKEAYLKGNVYCATKHAIDGLTRAMRMDLVQHGIRVTQVAPGAVETEFSQVRFKGDDEKAKAVYKGYKPLQAGDVADVIFYAVSLPEHVCINDLVVMPTAQANTVHWNKQS